MPPRIYFKEKTSRDYPGGPGAKDSWGLCSIPGQGTKIFLKKKKHPKGDLFGELHRDSED